MYVTVFLTPGGEDPWVWGYSKAKGLGVEYLAFKATDAATGALKGATDRLRPDESNRRSFPSGHASQAFSSLRLANRNLDAMHIPPWARTSLKTGNYLMASACAWARVEARKHHPSDVLAGACLGNLITTFIHDAFMNLPEDNTFSFYIEPSPKGLYGAVSWSF
jgi:membrane-associated phospholipid phosphatase